MTSLKASLSLHIQYMRASGAARLSKPNSAKLKFSQAFFDSLLFFKSVKFFIALGQARGEAMTASKGTGLNIMGRIY